MLTGSTMPFQPFKGIILLLLCSIITPVAAETPLKLPQTLPALSAPDSATLGSNEADIGKKIGETVPSFKIKSQNDRAVAWTNLLQKAPLLVIFYRGGWCPYCNLQIKQLSEAYPEFEKRQVLPILISVDKPEATTLSQKTYDIPFPVLSDSDLNAHNAFDVVLTVDDKTYQLYKQYGIVLEDWSGENHHKIAVASSFIVSKDSKILWAHTSTDYKTRPSIPQLLQVIDKLTAETK